jgi:hypothetical protein
MLLASDALSKFDGSTAPPTSPAQQPSPPAHQPETHPTPPTPTPSAALATEPASVPSQQAAAPVTPVAEPRAKETPPQGGSTRGEEEETEGPQAVATATTNLNSAKAEAKLVKALDYLVAINDNSDNPAQKWVINESILASLTGCFRPAIKKFVETHRSFINQANNTHGLGTRPQPWQGKDQPRRHPSFGQELQKGCPGPAVLEIHTSKLIIQAMYLLNVLSLTPTGAAAINSNQITKRRHLPGPDPGA